MRSIFLFSIIGVFAEATQCQTDENSLLQAKSIVRHSNTAVGAKTVLRNVRQVADSLVEGSSIQMTRDEVQEALDAAAEAIAGLEPAIQQQIQNAQQQVNDATAAVRACHSDEQTNLRATLVDQVAQRSTAVEQCENNLEHLRAAETQQCATAEDCLCDEARVRTQDQEALCVSVTETYEVTFCESNTLCNLFHECHAAEIEVYSRLRSDVEAEMAVIVQEYIAVEQAQCLTNLIMMSMTSGSPIPPADLISCSDVDVSALNLVFPSLPDEPAACPAHAHGDPECVSHRTTCLPSMSHIGRYLPGHAAGDSTRRSIQESIDRCVELGDQCSGITCRSDSDCTVRAGGDLRNSPSNEFSFVKAACASHCPSHAGKYLGGYAAGDSTQRNIRESRERCIELGAQCNGVTCRSAASGDSTCTVRAGVNGLHNSPSNEFSFVKAEC